jgi:type I restriction enzyme S subunit
MRKNEVEVGREVGSRKSKFESVPLAEVARINPPLNVNGISMETLASFVPMAAVSELTGQIIKTETRKIDDCRRGYTSFKNGDVLVAKITPCFENGKIALAQIPHDYGFGSTEFHVMRADEERLLPKYLFYFLRQPCFRVAGEHRMTGSAGQRRVPSSFLSTFEIPLPTLSLQKRIAAILDKADAIRRKRQQAIKLADDFLRATFLDMFGDPVTNPRGWPRRRLGDLLRVNSGNFLSAKQMDSRGSYPVYGGNGINGLHSEYMFEQPVIAIGRVGAYCGSIHLTAPKSWITDNALYVAEKTNDIIETYLEWALRFANLNQYSSQVGQPLISGNRIYPVEILVPDLATQARFYQFLHSQKELEQNLTKYHGESEKLFNSLTQRAFRGDL